MKKQFGDSIILREVWNKKIWTIRPAKVIVDSEQLIALYIMDGTITKHPVSLDHKPLPYFLPPEWTLKDRTFTGGRLILSIPHRHFMVYLSKQNPTDSLTGWYVNLQTPLKRTQMGFDYLDQELDLVISHDKQSWEWKDEQAFQNAISRGVIQSEIETTLRNEAQFVLSLLKDSNSIFNQNWENWQVPNDWKTPKIPHNWQTDIK